MNKEPNVVAWLAERSTTFIGSKLAKEREQDWKKETHLHFVEFWLGTNDQLSPLRMDLDCPKALTKPQVVKGKISSDIDTFITTLSWLM